MAFVHVTLHVSDLERSVGFYQRLGLSVTARIDNGHGGIAFLGDGPTKVELIGDGRGIVDYDGISVGFTSTDAGGLARSLDEGFVGPISPNPGTVYYFVRDPDGFNVQIMQE